MYIQDMKVEILADSEDIINAIRFDLASNHIQLLEMAPRESGNNIQIQCPYHNNGQERKPSAGIRKSDGLLHCFACGETHTLPEVISYCFGKNDNGYYGQKWLFQHFDCVKANYPSKWKEQEKPVEEQQKFVSEDELDSYRYTHPYWAKRGIVEDWVIEFFDLGYDRQNQMITMPVRDIQGRCEFVAKRSVNTKFFQYPAGVSKPLYGLYELSIAGMSYAANGRGSAKRAPIFKDIFICESMIDCILLWQSGHFAFALNGLGNERQFKQLNEVPVSHYILCTDNDEAGQSARLRIRKNVRKICSEIQFPKGIKDIGECSREQIDNIRTWEKFI